MIFLTAAVVDAHLVRHAVMIAETTDEMTAGTTVEMIDVTTAETGIDL